MTEAEINSAEDFYVSVGFAIAILVPVIFSLISLWVSIKKYSYNTRSAVLVACTVASIVVTPLLLLIHPISALSDLQDYRPHGPDEDHVTSNMVCLIFFCTLTAISHVIIFGLNITFQLMIAAIQWRYSNAVVPDDMARETPRAS